MYFNPDINPKQNESQHIRASALVSMVKIDFLCHVIY
jgi:hypothetical protein